MAVEVADLLQPHGELETDLFTDTVERATVWLQQGKDKAIAANVSEEANVDAAATAWAYHRAFKTKAALMSQTYNSGNLEGLGGESYAKDQRDRFAALADEWLAVYEGYVPVVETPSSAPSVPVSRSVRVRTVMF